MPWGPERLADLERLCAAALPGELLRPDDLARTCWDEPPEDPDGGRCGPSFTLGVDGPDGAPWGAVGVAMRHLDDLTVGHLQVLVVDPEVRRQGIGSALVDAARAAATGRGAQLFTAGSAAPYYLYTGVDSRWTAALCLFESLGWTTSGVGLDLGCDTRAPRPAPPEGVRLEVAAGEEGRADAAAFAARCFPEWRAELVRGVDTGHVVLARDVAGMVVGAAAHSVNRVGVVGPMGVDPALQRGGTGAALLGALLADLAAQGIARAEIQWVSNVSFYAKAAGATVVRSSLHLNPGR
ncbi:MAG: GNAT family N-acetyltransferase [Microthrixaceae bacterium]